MNLSILTPDKELFSGEITAVNVPGIKAPFQVLNNHAPIVSSLEKGEVTVKTSAGSEETFSIESGFIEVLNNNISILAQPVKEEAK